MKIHCIPFVCNFPTNGDYIVTILSKTVPKIKKVPRTTCVYFKFKIHYANVKEIGEETKKNEICIEPLFMPTYFKFRTSAVFLS